MDGNSIGKQIQKYRCEAGLSQEQLAEKIDRSAIFISHIERGIKNPGFETLIRISRVLNVPIDILLGNTGNVLPGRLKLIEKKLGQLPNKTQMRLLDILEAAIKIESDYN